MDDKEIIVSKSVPHFKLSLDSLRNNNQSSFQSSSIISKKFNASKMRNEPSKTKMNFQRMKEMQQAPKISYVSKALINKTVVPDTPKFKYIKKLKTQLASTRTKPVRRKEIDYSLVKSVSAFAIYSNDSLTSPVLQEKIEEKTPKNMYAKGIKFLKIKNQNRERKKEKIEEEILKGCTFSPCLSKITSKSTRENISIPNKSSEINSCKSLSPHERKIAYITGFDLAKLKISIKKDTKSISNLGSQN